jgi:hypothetical protein
LETIIAESFRKYRPRLEDPQINIQRSAVKVASDDPYHWRTKQSLIGLFKVK